MGTDFGADAVFQRRDDFAASRVVFRIRAEDSLRALRSIQGLMEKLGRVNVGPKDAPETQVSAAEFVLEGLHAHKRIGRNEERVFIAGEKQPKRQEKPFDPEEQPYRTRRTFN